MMMILFSSSCIFLLLHQQVVLVAGWTSSTTTSPRSPLLQASKQQRLVASPTRGRFSLGASVTGGDDSPQNLSYQTLFDFADDATTAMVERLDDAIMGGISTSSVQNATDQAYARWVGVCRVDGGGFCGFRTNPFVEPLATGDADGFYLDLRLASDNEASRRMWKMSTRTKPDRGELLYQAPVTLQDNNDDAFQRIQVPFDSFRLVRGPRMIDDGPPLNTTSGVYQVGMTMSKFVFGPTTTELENFRPGFFEVHLKEIGLYKATNNEPQTATANATATALSHSEPKVFTEKEAKKRRPFIIKLLLPISKLFFSEQSQRRKSAMRILRDKRGLSRTGAILFGLRSRAQSFGMIRSITKAAAILATDSARSVVSLSLRIALVYPIRLIRKTLLGMKNVVRKPPQSD